MRNFIHKELAAGRWFELTLMEQLGNIGSEVYRVAEWKKKIDAEKYGLTKSVGEASSTHDGSTHISKTTSRFEEAVDKALDLFDLTLEDKRWIGRRKEIARAREVFCDAYYGGHLYKSTFSDLVKYFDLFAVAANKVKVETENPRQSMSNA